MKIEIYGELIECGSVIKGKDSITVLDENGGVICEASGISDFSGYVMVEGEWVGEITVEDIPDSPEEQIAKLKTQLESTDYKIIKCSEAQLVGEELPYDIVALHAERQALRDRINELESEVVV